MKKALTISNKILFLLIMGVFVILISCDSKDTLLNKNSSVINDSISIWITESKDNSLNFQQRKNTLLKAYNYNSSLEKDSLKNRSLLKIAFEAYRQKDSAFFKKVNKEALLLSQKIKDSFGIADAHWNFGNFFSNNEIRDSAYYHYYKANKLYEAINHNYYSAKMLYNMALIQSSIKDYTGSEKLIVKAISKFKPLEKNLNLYRSYNHLGIIYKEFEEYERAVFYHNQALDYLKKTDDNRFYEEGSYNNLSLVYQKWKNYSEAINYLSKALTDEKIKAKEPKLYARLIDNLAYNKFLKGDTIGLSMEFYKALNIRDSLNDVSGIIINKLHLAEYYLKANDTVKAIRFANDADELSQNTNNNRDHLAALKLLSKTDAVNSNQHLNNYITLGDSLQKEERKIREKFTRIRFETDEYVEETERLSQQKIWILVLSFTSILVLSLSYFLMRQRTKNKELIYEAEQQKSNEEIYRLMLKEHTSLENGRLLERNRISEELHDGVLGRLFGTRMSLGFLDIKGSSKTIQEHSDYVEELQKIEKEIRVISHELKSEILSTKLSYMSIIENLLKSQHVIGKFEYKLTCNEPSYWDQVDNEIKINLYRIIQESIQNINKYSQAKNVIVDFEIKGNIVKLSLEDDGVGFNDKKISKKGIGLINIQDRVAKLGGSFSIKTAKNKGTKILIESPI